MSVVKDTFQFAGALIVVVLASLFCFFVIKFTFNTARGVNHWWHNFTTTTPEEAARNKAQDEAWAKNPLNPELIAQKCLDAGGFPKQSSWDGSVTCLDKNGNSKSVNIEVNQ